VEQTKAAARRKFDRWAGSYEHDRPSRSNARPQQEALAALALLPGDRFLDVGCGTGGAVRRAAAIVERAVGLDISPGMIERAKALAAESARADFVVGESERLPFPDGTFTAVLCTASFHHYPNPRRALAEIARLLTVDGRLALADGIADLRIARVLDSFMRRFDRSHVRLYRTSELLAYLDEAGFADVGVRHLWDGGYAIALARRATQPSRPASP
jgi:ubiquinone/menaquinone biosynthesis C-methylase UbiE